MAVNSFESTLQARNAERFSPFVSVCPFPPAFTKITALARRHFLPKQRINHTCVLFSQKGIAIHVRSAMGFLGEEVKEKKWVLEDVLRAVGDGVREIIRGYGEDI